MALAEGFGLPHLPRMPELKRADTSAFVPHSTPPSLIPFKNKIREKARQAKLAREGESGTGLSSELHSYPLSCLLSALAGKTEGKCKKPRKVYYDVGLPGSWMHVCQCFVARGCVSVCVGP